METEETQYLKTILSEEEFEKVPTDVQKKIESIYGERFAEFLVQKGLCDTARNSIDQIRTESEEKISELTLKYQDESAKLTLSEQSVAELRDMLQTSKDELNRTQDTLARYEQETTEYRRERNNVLDERDSLLKMCERRSIEVERLQSDVQKLEQQLSAAINAKCEALAKLDEIASKEANIDYKEKRFEQERQMLQNQIQSLTNDLNRNIGELQNSRREYSLKAMTIETKLNQKTEELNIANGQIAHLQEQNGALSAKAEELSGKLLEQNEDMRKMMEHYKKELHSQSKLADLYKETSDDKTKQTAELASAVTELQKLLHEATDEYGQLETQLKGIDAKHDRELEAKNQEIQALKDELKNANDLLRLSQEENLEHVVEKLAPTAAATSRMLKTGMSLTELYSKFVQATEEVQLEKKENARLNLQMNTIMQEIEEKAPIMKKQQIEYKNAIQANAELTNQLESLIQERVNMRQEVNDTSGKIGYYEREMSKLKAERGDLGRQVCYLLKQIEEMRGGFAMERDQSISSEMSANEVITKKLVTFSDIQELQENNMKLLLLVRDLSGKLEEMEEVQNNMSQATYEAKLANYTKRLQEMQETQEYQTQMMTNCLQQRDRYKKMYTDMLKGKSGAGSLNGSLMDTGDDDDLASSVSSQPDANAAGGTSSAAAASEHKRKLANLEEKLQDTQKKLQELKEEYDNYRKEKMTNDKMVNEQFDSMRKEMLDLTSANCKLTSTVQYNSEQFKMQQKNVATYKKQISILEERNKNYEATIIKHEANLMYLKDETLASQAKLGRAEAMVESLKQETRMLRDKETRLQAEREVFQRERQNQSLLLNNLEMIKATFERSETDGKMRLEQRLDEASRECSALRRRLQEEQDRFRELTVHLERQSETARQRMEEEVVIAEKLREELKTLRAELAAKAEKVDDLGKKLQESLAPSRSDNPITQATKRIKELELKLGESAIELKALQQELDQSKEHAKQYCNMATTAEKELKELNDAYSAYRAEIELDLAQTKKNEATLKAKVEEMETEIALQITGAQLTTGDTNSTLHKAQRELQDALTKISENNRELRELRNLCDSLQESLQETEQKYANEMMLHSQDIQAAQNLKDELQKTKKQFDELQSTRDRAVNELEANKTGWQVNLTTLQAQKDELEQRVVDLNDQNAALHDQIQTLSTKLSITLSAAAQDRELPTASDAMNESTTANDSLLAAIAANKSIHEDDVKSSEQLLQIIKYLRKEKDIAVAKFDILRSENVRLHSELEMLNKKLQELQEELVSERAKSEAGGITANKHDEIMRKVETLNAVTDSNRVLREERDTLSRKVRDLNDRLTKVEDELFPLQEKNCELTAKVESVGAENASLRIEATKWRQRANLLVERSNKTSPEDWKKLQTERDTLTKALAAEKEALRKASEELVQLRADKTRLDAEVQTWSRQATTSGDENKKYVEELNVLRQAGVRMTQEINEVKATLSKREEELKQITENLTQRDAQLLDARNKEVQIRKIAKRYKDSYFELKNKVDEKNANGGEVEGEDAAAGGEPSAALANIERVTALETEILELKTQVTTSQQEMEAMRRENEGLKVTQEKDDRNKLLLKEAKVRILTLTETKNTIARELATAKTQLQALEQSRDEHELLVNGLKSQYDTKLQRLTDQDQESKEALTRLQRENETLAMRINQLHRQMGIQQGAKPTTSGVGAGGEKIAAETAPRTANVKPMAGTSSTGQQSATVTPRRGGETPLASIRPMSVQQSSRTAAVLPTSQTPQGSSTSSSSTTGGSGTSTSSVTALVPPQQQVHTTGNSSSSNSGGSAEAMSSSPTSSHTDYQLCTTSSAIAVVAAIPQQQQQEPGTAESSSQQEPETAPNNDTTSSTTNNTPAVQQPSTGGQQLQQQQQQAVALVSPRVESAPQMVAPQQLSPQNVEQNQASTSTSNIPVAMSSSHHQASSSNTVTTTQAGGHKRPRDVEGDSSTSQSEEQSEKTQPQKKRTRVQDGVSESGLDVEYQVPTSSQRDQEDDGIIVVDSDEEDEEEDEMDADEGDVNEADGMEDAGENYEMDGSYQDHDMAQYDEGGPDIDENDDEDEEGEDNNTNNEVDVDDDSEVPNQSGAAPGSVQPVAPIATTTSSTTSTSAGDSGDNVAAGEASGTDQQIQSISSGSDAAGTSSSTPSSQTWRQAAPHSRQQQAHLMIMQQQGYEDVEDRIVPSTPTLFAPRSAASPHPAQVPHAARFTFNESTASTTAPQRNAVVPEGMDDTRVDLSDEANDSTISTGRSVPSTPQQVSAPQDLTTAASTTGTAGEEAEAATSQQNDQPEGEPVDGGEEAPSHSEVPEISVTAASEEDDYISESNDDQAGPSQEHKDPSTEAQEPEEDGADGVSSEGEKTATDSSLVVEEGSEAEVLEAPSSNTRSRSTTPNRNHHRGGGRGRGYHGPPRPTPIVWQDSPRPHGNQFQQQQQQQRGNRARRTRRPTGQGFGNMRY